MKKIFVAVLTLLAVFSCVCAFGCGSGEEEQEFGPFYYTLTFDYAEGGGTETSRTVEYGSAVNNLPTPSELPSGKKFDCWKMKDGRIFANGTTYSFINDVTLTASYSYEEYYIAYDVAGGDPLPNGAITSYSISTDNITLPVTTKTGYNFTGWNSGTGTITEIAAGTTGNLNLTAVWQAKEYTITFDYGDGTGTETVRNVHYNDVITELPAPATLPAGMIFVGWKTESGNAFASSTVYAFDENITLTASYSYEEYYIAYDVAGGNPLPNGAITAYSISTDNITLPVTTKTGYNFTGWNSGTGTITEIAAGTTGNLNLTAVWQAKEYTITFDYGDGTGTETVRNVHYNDVITELPAPATLPAGKYFAGWRMEDNSTFVSSTVYAFDENITLVANYGLEIYSITYDVAGGDPLPVDAITSYSISSENIILPVTTQTGFDVMGWNNGTKTMIVIAAGTTGDLNLTAVWEDDNGGVFAVTLNNQTAAGFTAWKDGTQGAKQVAVNEGGTLDIPEIIYDDYNETQRLNDDYYLKGWFYVDKYGTERKFIETTEFSLENLNVMGHRITVYAKVAKAWAGPY